MYILWDSVSLGFRISVKLILKQVILYHVNLFKITFCSKRMLAQTKKKAVDLLEVWWIDFKKAYWSHFGKLWED